jgi:hypothetical protein
MGYRSGWSIQMDPAPFENFSRDDFSFSIYRVELPSFYLISSGLPDFFFANLAPALSNPPLVYNLRSIDYGFQVNAWVTEDIQLRINLPFEANTLEDSNLNAITLDYNTDSQQNIGDLELGATYLLSGRRSGGNFIGLDGWYRFATGSNPFSQYSTGSSPNLPEPLLATGKGTPEGSLGFILQQQLGRFSLFEGLHYQHSLPLVLTSSDSFIGPGVFQWPDELQALGRVEFLVFERAQRMVTFFYELSMRKTGSMFFNHIPVTYDQGHYEDQLFFSGGGITVRVDPQMTVEGELTYFPAALDGQSRPDDGLLLFLSVIYRPFDL